MSSSSVQFTIRRGSIMDFCYDPNPQRSAIVNAANQDCLGGGGLDAAINKAGGPQLQQDRKALPVLRNHNTRNEVRCPKGEARSTGPGRYGSLKVPYVIHAVGADYRKVSHLQQGDDLVQSAYRSSLEVAEILQLEAVAFPLLSGGAFRGSRELKEIVKIGLETMRSFPTICLKHIYVYAFSAQDFGILQALAKDLAFSPTEISYSMPQPFSGQVQSHAPSHAQPFTPSAPISSTIADLSTLNILPPPVAVPAPYAPSAPPATAPSAVPPAATATGYNAAVYVHNGGSSPSPLHGSDIAQLKILEGNFHALIRHETQKQNIKQQGLQLPNLVDLAKRDDAPTKGQYYPIQGMNGGYDTQLVYDARSRDWTVTCTTWIKADQGPRPKHSITKDGIQSVV